MKPVKLFGNEQHKNALGACSALILDNVSIVYIK